MALHEHCEGRFIAPKAEFVEELLIRLFTGRGFASHAVDITEDGSELSFGHEARSRLKGSLLNNGGGSGRTATIFRQMSCKSAPRTCHECKFGRRTPERQRQVDTEAQSLTESR
jgi:hypothetical protein